MNQPLIIVSPWYGPDTAGGAETQARQLARSLHVLGVDVQVWSSTGRDGTHPNDTAHYPAGSSELDGVPVQRFAPSAPDTRGVPLFFAAHPELLPDITRFPPHELRLLGSLMSSDGLYEAILAQRTGTFLFIPYPFPSSFWGALLVRERAWLLPCLHDEPYARYSTYRFLFENVRGVLANSHGEAALAQQLYDLPDECVVVAGEGIELNWRGDGARFRKQYGLGEIPLLMYAGRLDASKNLPLLLAYVREYWARRGKALRLLIVGQATKDAIFIPQSLNDLVLNLGFVDPQTKHDAYAAADLFVQPSILESFSIVLMEAWLQGTPALVNSDCVVTRDHCERSGGGLHFGSFAEFAAALDLLLARPDLRRVLGQRGCAYVRETCHWEDVAQRTASALGVDYSNE